MKTICIRVDANPYIGMGHIMRCLSIADVFKLYDCYVTFIIADNWAKNLIQQRGYDVFVLDSDYQKMDDENDLWLDTIKPDIIIVDSYYVTSSFLISLKKKSKLIYIDDLALFPYPVDVLVNYNVYGFQVDYKTLYGHNVDKPKFLIGIKYAPLRNMFKNINLKEQKRDVKHILLSTGGADDIHFALRFVKSILPNYNFHVLIGAMNQDRDEIAQVTAKKNNVILHENVADMKSLILACDIAISAAGSTMYEICACGVPLITCVLADNQIPGAEAFEKTGIAINCGDFRIISHPEAEIIKAVESLANNYDRRCEVGVRMQSMIDGYGADRLVKELLCSNDKVC